MRKTAPDSSVESATTGLERGQTCKTAPELERTESPGGKCTISSSRRDPNRAKSALKLAHANSRGKIHGWLPAPSRPPPRPHTSRPAPSRPRLIDTPAAGPRLIDTPAAAPRPPGPRPVCTLATPRPAGPRLIDTPAVARRPPGPHPRPS